MKELVIEKFYYQQIEITDHPAREARERFKRYYHDLHQAEQKPAVDPDSYLHGAQYSYVQLAESILPKIQAEGYLEGLELMRCCFALIKQLFRITLLVRAYCHSVPVFALW
jgi:hypothetical protein